MVSYMNESHFKPFNEHEKVRIYRRSLPHWRQYGCTYFVTFRTGDSLPASVVRNINDEQRSWLCGRGIVFETGEEICDVLSRLPHEDLHHFHISFCRAVNRHLDECHGRCLLSDIKFSKMVMSALLHFDGKRVWIGDAVIMPNHVHVLMCPIGDNELEDILCSIKSFSARQINSVTGESGTNFWQRDTYDHIVRNRIELNAYIKYIDGNPDKANISACQYLYRQAV